MTTDMLFILFLALLIFGPKKLPEISRQIGRFMAEFRRASFDFKSQIEGEIRQLEIDETIKKERESLGQILAPEGALAASDPSSTVPTSSEPFSLQQEPSSEPSSLQPETCGEPSSFQKEMEESLKMEEALKKNGELPGQKAAEAAAIHAEAAAAEPPAEGPGPIPPDATGPVPTDAEGSHA